MILAQDNILKSIVATPKVQTSLNYNGASVCSGEILIRFQPVVSVVIILQAYVQ